MKIERFRQPSNLRLINEKIVIIGKKAIKRMLNP
jgi:hypothetical protein